MANLANSLVEAGKTAQFIAGDAIHASFSYVKGGGFSIKISSNSAQVVRDVCITAVTLSAIYAGYQLLARKIDGAVTRALGGEREDQEIRDIKPGSLHVQLHCFTDERFLQIVEEYESGKMKERFYEEFKEIGVEVEGLEVQIENMDELEARKEMM